MRGRPPKSPVVPSNKIWVDADQCPAPILQLLFRLADTRRMILTVVACKTQRWPDSAYVRGLVLGEGFDATARIAAMMDEGDYVVTDNAELATAAQRRRATALNTRGQPHAGTDAPHSVANYLATVAASRNRSLDEVLQRKDQQAFAASFDHMLGRATRAAQAAAQARIKAQQAETATED